uniref:Uncharacterized protein n=1 Tax=Oncorhynchus mykiss TaxID=8022 RepID=A0A8C7VED9_ONCMY
MAPLPVVHLLITGLQLDTPRPHVHETLGAPVAEQQQAAGFCGAEVEGDGACFLGVPLGQGDEGLGGLKGDGVQGGHVLTAEDEVSVQADLRVPLDGQPGEF